MDFRLESLLLKRTIKAMAPSFRLNRAYSRFLQRLLNNEPGKQAAKLAGLSKPTKCK